MIENTKVESLSILRQDSSAGQTSNINFNYAYNSSIQCIKSKFCNFSHIESNYSSNLTIAGSHFQDSYGYGGGGRAYGVVFQFASGECLLYNNQFDHLRHSVLLQAGANGNVISYNYSINPFWTGVALPADAAGELVLHGNYVYTNLFEGNTVQNIVIDNSHGINGPYNTFFRNRANNYGIVMSSPQATDSINFVGNEVTNTQLFRGNYLLAGVGHFQHCNNIKGVITPAGTNTLPDSSYYLTSVPAFYLTNSSWPPIGPPNTISAHQIEAQIEHTAGNYTQCPSAIVTSLSSTTHTHNAILNVFPNPFDNNLTIQLSDNTASITQIQFYDVSGRLVLETYSQTKLIVSDLNSGIYLLKVILNDGRIMSHMLIKN